MFFELIPKSSFRKKIVFDTIHPEIFFIKENTMKMFKSLIISSLIFLQQNFASAEEDNSSYEFYGKHFIASYLECDSQAIADEKKLQEVLIEASKACGAEILKSASYVFDTGGLTQVVLLSESHASIHTYPEYQSCFVDLFTCGHRCDWKAFDQVMQKYLNPKKTQIQVIIRD